jgi:hypothetical protein
VIIDDLEERAEQVEAQRRERVHHGALRAGLPCPVAYCEQCTLEDEWRRYRDDSPVLATLEAP